jgi:hypothetical protein
LESGLELAFVICFQGVSEHQNRSQPLVTQFSKEMFSPRGMFMPERGGKKHLSGISHLTFLKQEQAQPHDFSQQSNGFPNRETIKAEPLTFDFDILKTELNRPEESEYGSTPPQMSRGGI